MTECSILFCHVMLLELDSVYVGYSGGRDVLSGASLLLKHGERLVICGDNASGKSTLLRVAAGLLKPRAGTVRYAGASSPAFLFQNPREQLICTTVLEEIEFALRLCGEPTEKLSERAAELLERFELDTFAARAPQALSGGQMQRLALAALFCRAPELLLLDEPDVFLDGRSRRDFRSFVERLDKNVAVLWMISRQSEFPEQGRRMRLRDGRLAELDKR